MTSIARKFIPFAERMQAEGLSEIAIDTFKYYYGCLIEGQTGLIPEDEIKPVDSLHDVETFPPELVPELVKVGQASLSKSVLIKLNGGLGTSMGLDRPKSLLSAKGTLSFLDIVARQARRDNIPLVLMNSFATRDHSLAALKQYPELHGNIPLDFLQHKVPKVTQADLTPAVWTRDPSLEWCPPGHGDIYAALISSNMLSILLEAGYEYAFVSNVDNLGATMDTAILGYFVRSQLHSMMEVTDRTQADKKGGHLARRLDGRLSLREYAQCPTTDMEAFQDTTRYRYFNTNNIWLDLAALEKLMACEGNALRLPMIVNRKPVDPRDNTSTSIYQLETAMGSAIGVFKKAGAIRVPRARFVPVKTTNDLLAIRSDVYTLTDDVRIVLNPCRKLGPVMIDLDPHYYKLIDDMETRCAYGVPSLMECQQLSVVGDIRFGRNVTLKGSVRLINESKQQIRIEDVVVSEDVRW